ncbi:carbon-nitrogen hydrolase family protein [Vibrio maritimus]|uniref:carbon-nitrogen hydrolase family protein n=1 Tax=Vibrio maritimus TaxID=990268 RepID=UPI001F3C152B|nr:carbon-nitrogen hydrolase family protein [Vibrio maritimus]
MKFALLQFPVSAQSSENHAQIKRALCEAKRGGADVLVTQECALSGYPPIEIDAVADIDFELQYVAFNQIVDLVQETQVTLFLGLIRKFGDKVANSVAIIKPSGEVYYYDKRALWGWDAENFNVGSDFNGVVEIQGIKVGVRICYEIRFPEYFRELYKEQVDVAIVSLCDVQQKFDANRYSIIKSHLVTRAIENVFTVMSINSTTFEQTAPTAVIDKQGNFVVEAERNKTSITYFNYEKTEHGFGTKGCVTYSNKLLGLKPNGTKLYYQRSC